MRETFIMLTVAVTAFAAGAIASSHAEATPIGLYYWPGYYSPSVYYPPYAYSRYVCRAWWKGCGWEPGHYWNYWPNRYYGPYGYRW